MSDNEQRILCPDAERKSEGVFVDDGSVSVELEGLHGAAVKGAIAYLFDAGRQDEFALYSAIERLGPETIRKVHPGARDVCANVDLYSGFVYDMLGIPQDLYTPIFAVGRVVGWCAHRMEELDNAGPIIRPAYKPICCTSQYIPLNER